jgi:23S rRNA (guanosine2251-2'-O)-methyltransferase
MRRHAEKIEKVYLTKKDAIPGELLKKFGPRTVFVENRHAQSMSRGGNHQGVLVKMEDFEEADAEEVKRASFVVVLDSLTDTGNIGAIVRSAYALGVDAIVACGVKQLNFAAIARTSSGALFDMPFSIRHNILDLLNEMKQSGFSCYGASMEGRPVEEMRFEAKRLLVLGSEDRGIGSRAREKLDGTVSIVMKREFDSLNVSAAAAIIIYRMSHAQR